MMLAFFRYVLVCWDRTSWLNRHISELVKWKGVLAILSAILVPAIGWCMTMYFCSPATGRIWYFALTTNSTNQTSITVFQPISDTLRGTFRPIVLVMALLILLQLLLTLFFYVCVCYTTWMSTMNIVLKKDADDDVSNKQSSQALKRNSLCDSSMDDVMSTSSASQRNHSTYLESLRIDTTKIASIASINSLNSKNMENRPHSTVIKASVNVHEKTFENSIENEPSIIKNSRHEPKSLNIRSKAKPNQSSIVLKYENPDAIERVKESNQNAILDLNNCSSSLNAKHCPNEQKIVEVQKENTSSKKKKRKFFLPTADDYASSADIAGAHKLNIPLTEVVLCVTQKDITCTAALTSQIVCLCITSALIIYVFQVTGLKITLERYISGIYCMEIGFIMHTLVDPIVCIIFSSNYRVAAKNILQKERNNGNSVARRKGGSN